MKYKDVAQTYFSKEQLAVKEIFDLVSNIEPEYGNDVESEAVVWGMDTNCGSFEGLLEDAIEILKKHNLIPADKKGES